jgi:hypothetical protein
MNRTQKCDLRCSPELAAIQSATKVSSKGTHIKTPVPTIRFNVSGW